MSQCIVHGIRRANVSEWETHERLKCKDEKCRIRVRGRQKGTLEIRDRKMMSENEGPNRSTRKRGTKNAGLENAGPEKAGLENAGPVIHVKRKRFVTHCCPFLYQLVVQRH